MGRNRALLGIAVAVGAASAIAVVLVAWDRAGSDGPAPGTGSDPISATATFAPRVALFGDTVTARVDVIVDRTVVDPDGVEVSWSSRPWTQVREPQRARQDAGSMTYLRTTFVLRCLTDPCAPARETEEIDFDPARVTYAAPVGESTGRLSIDVRWPTLVVHTRISQSDATQRDALASPWRADFVSLPLVSYRASPALVLAVLLVGGTLLVALAAVVAYRALPRREPPPEPEPPPAPVGTPLEQALALLESPGASNGVADRRRALELVADEVERLGDEELAQAARALAWSEDAPHGEATRAIAAQLRRRMESADGNPA